MSTASHWTGSSGRRDAEQFARVARLDDLAQGDQIVARDHVLDLGLDVESAPISREDRHDGIDAADGPDREAMPGDVCCEVLAGSSGSRPLKTRATYSRATATRRSVVMVSSIGDLLADVDRVERHDARQADAFASLNPLVRYSIAAPVGLRVGLDRACPDRSHRDHRRAIQL